MSKFDLIREFGILFPVKAYSVHNLLCCLFIAIVVEFLRKDQKPIIEHKGKSYVSTEKKPFNQ